MLGFIVAIAAGFLTPHLDKPVSGPLMAAAAKVIEIDRAETRLVSFMVALLGAGIVANLLDSGSAFWVVVGAVIGYFLTRLTGSARAAMDRRRG